MDLSSAKPGDLILADIKGRRFYAEIRAREGIGLNVMPLDNRISYRTVTARQVKGLWHKSRRGSRTASPAGDGISILAPRGMRDYA